MQSNHSKPKLLVSACLLGQETRYDGAHKYCASLFDEAFSDFELRSICPELEIGLGVPRAPINLYKIHDRIEIIAEDERGTNLTQAMRRFCQEYLAQIPGFCGIVLKKNSPSCGISGVKLYHATASAPIVNNNGIGEFAYQLLHYLSRKQLTIPVIDEEQLQQPEMKRNFIKRARAHWQTQF